MKASRNPARSSWTDRAHSSTLVGVGLALIAVGGAMWAPTLVRWRLGGDGTCFMLILCGIAMAFGASLVVEWFKRLMGVGIANQRHYEAPAAGGPGESHPLFPKPTGTRTKGRWQPVRLAAVAEASLRKTINQAVVLAICAVPLAGLAAWFAGLNGDVGSLVSVWVGAVVVLFLMVRMARGVWPGIFPARYFIELGHEPVEPGRTVRVCVGASRAMRAQALRLAVVCREVASHGSGSDRVTKTHQAREIELLTLGNPSAEIGKPLAEVMWEVPVDAMHSFVGANNEVAWQLVLAVIEESGAAHVATVALRVGTTLHSPASPEP